MNAERGKLPAFQFYPGDWQKDPGVRASSLQARGLWLEMMCLMHHGEPYGHLTINGKAMNERTLSRLVGAEMKRTCASLKELESNGVFSRTKDGIIFSRRMVKDAYLRAIRSNAGSLGGKVTGQILLKQMPKQNPKQNTPPSSSDVKVKGEQPKPYSSKTGVKHQTAREEMEDTPTAWLAPESPPQETALYQEPPEPIQEFREWVKDHVPAWCKKKASVVWQDVNDRTAVDEIFRGRALFEIQACWSLYVRPGTKAYDHASAKRFAMREFQRQIEFLAGDPEYSDRKRKYLDGHLAPAIR